MTLSGMRALPRRGFTLIEMLLVISLIILLAGVLVWGGGRSLSAKDKSPKEQVREILDKVRRKALLENRDLALSWEKADKGGGGSLVARDGATEVLREAVKDAPEAFEVRFLSTTKKSSFTLIGGELQEHGEASAVFYYGDGTCSPFRLQLKYSDSSDILTIDPWTCAPVIREKDSKS